MRRALPALAHTALALAVALPLALAATSPALAGDLRAPVLAALAGVEDVPTAAELQAIGAGVEGELMEIAQDNSLVPTTRARAVHALGWFPSEGSQALLRSTLTGGDTLLARKAAYALANGWGDASVPLLQPALAASDVQLRIATVRALDGVGSEAARSALGQRLTLEANAEVAATIRKALAD